VVIQDFCVWVSGAPASVAGSIARAVELALAGCAGRVVHAGGRPTPAARDGYGRIVEVFVGELTSIGDEAAPDIVVSGDGARAGESARTVLRHLADAGYSEPDDEYSDDDEAAVSVRLQSFGYL
jgi:hypothetical protein